MIGRNPEISFIIALCGGFLAVPDIKRWQEHLTWAFLFTLAELAKGDSSWPIYVIGYVLIFKMLCNKKSYRKAKSESANNFSDVELELPPWPALPSLSLPDCYPTHNTVLAPASCRPGAQSQLPEVGGLLS